MPQLSRTDGPGSSRGIDAESSRRTRPPPSEGAQRQANVTAGTHHPGILDPMREGNPYEEALVRALFSTTGNVCRAMRDGNQQMLNVWYERAQMLNRKWYQRSARPLPESDDQMMRRTGLPLVRHPEIKTMLQAFTHPGKLRRMCQLRLEELIATSTDDSPEIEELITQYTRLLLNPTQADAEGGTAAQHNATDVNVDKGGATGGQGKSVKDRVSVLTWAKAHRLLRYLLHS